MKRLHLLLLTMATLGMAGTASAEFDYTFVQGSYGQYDFDDLDIDGDTFGFAASGAISENWHIFGGAEFADLDGVDVTDLAVGLGFNTALSEAIDVVAQLSYQRLDVDTPFGGGDIDGVGLGVGLRVAASDRVEINGGVTYVDFDGATETNLGAGFLFDVTENFAIGLSGDFDDDVQLYRLVGRYYF